MVLLASLQVPSGFPNFWTNALGRPGVRALDIGSAGWHEAKISPGTDCPHGM
jgi:hypothetical protein